MKAIVFRNSLPRLAAAKLGSYVTKAALVSPLGPVRLEDVPEPDPPGDGWVVADVLLAGFCGSDTKQVFLHGARDNPVTSLISFPHVMGHEAVVRRRDTGETAVVDPWLPCVPRGIEPVCPACAAGELVHCRNFTEGRLPPGIHLGNCSRVGGVHAEAITAHTSMLHPVPAGVSRDAAVLADPVSVSLHAVLRNPPDPARPALVYGCGTLGLAGIALLRHLHPELTIWAASRPKTADLARKFGADEILPPEPDALVESVARLSGARRLLPWSGKHWMLDGPGVVYDNVGSPESVETSLRLIGTQGTVVIAGVEAPKRFEWTPLYFKEVRVVGANAFSDEERRGVRKHAFEHYFDLVAAGLDVTAMITHRFTLERWKEAVMTIAHRRRTGAVKVVMEVGE